MFFIIQRWSILQNQSQKFPLKQKFTKTHFQIPASKSVSQWWLGSSPSNCIVRFLNSQKQTKKRRSKIINKTFSAWNSRQMIYELKHVLKDPCINHVKYGRRETKILQNERSLRELENLQIQNEIDKMLHSSVNIIMVTTIK